MELGFTQEQEILREMVRGVCAEYAPLDVVRQIEDDRRGRHVDGQLRQLVAGLHVVSRQHLVVRHHDSLR